MNDEDRNILVTYWQRTKALPPCWCYWRQDNYEWPLDWVKAADLEFIANQPHPDEHKWARRPHWAAEEATALSLGMDPDKIDLEEIEDVHIGRYYDAIKDLILKAQESKQLMPLMQPAAFIDWARRNDIDLPYVFEEALVRFEQDIIDLQPRYDDLKERFEEQERQITALHYDVEKRNMEIQKLGHELEEGKTRKPAKPKDIEDLPPKKLTTLYTLIYGLARRHYDYVDPNKRSNATARIVDHLRDVGIPIDHGAVLTALRDSANEFSELWSQPKS